MYVYNNIYIVNPGYNYLLIKDIIGKIIIIYITPLHSFSLHFYYLFIIS